MIFEPKTYLSNIPKSGIVEFKTIDQLFYLLLKKKKKKPTFSIKKFNLPRYLFTFLYGKIFLKSH